MRMELRVLQTITRKVRGLLAEPNPPRLESDPTVRLGTDPSAELDLNIAFEPIFYQRKKIQVVLSRDLLGIPADICTQNHLGMFTSARGPSQLSLALKEYVIKPTK